jgi:hypothetical protein
MSDAVAASGRPAARPAPRQAPRPAPREAPRPAPRQAPRQALRTAPRAVAGDRWTVPDARRKLQLALAALWLLDAVLQFQSAMFTPSFPAMLAGSAQQNPAIIAGPVSWSARLVEAHLAPANAVFAVIQLLLALGIAWRPTVKLALGASVAWALAVWWLGEGLGLVLTGTASPADGAPGAAVIYALLAVLLWPAAADRRALFIAGRAVGAPVARLLWVALWGGLACLALQPAVRAPGGMSRTLAEAASGQPGWLAWIDSRAAAAIGSQGLAACVVLAAALALVAAGALGPPALARAAIILALVLAAATWLAEGLGGIWSGAATDPETGPLLALVALAYWPAWPAPRAALPPRPAGLAEPPRPAGLAEPAGLAGLAEPAGPAGLAEPAGPAELAQPPAPAPPPEPAGPAGPPAPAGRAGPAGLAGSGQRARSSRPGGGPA